MPVRMDSARAMRWHSEHQRTARRLARRYRCRESTASKIEAIEIL